MAPSEDAWKLIFTVPTLLSFVEENPGPQGKDGSSRNRPFSHLTKLSLFKVYRVLPCWLRL